MMGLFSCGLWRTEKSNLFKERMEKERRPKVISLVSFIRCSLQSALEFYLLNGSN